MTTAGRKGQHRRMPTAGQKAGALAAEKKVAAASLFEPRSATVRMIPLCHIEVAPKRMRALRPKKVDEIAESIQARGGLLQPIVIRPRRQRKDSGECYSLVAGWHRFEAVRKLGHERIAAIILDGLDADAALLAEIDENLIRADLTPAERASHVGRRKELYEKLHPQTKRGGAPGAGRGKGKKKLEDGQVGQLPFTKDAAKKTGQSERKIRRDAQRGKDCVVLDDIAGTSLDKGDEIDALAKLPADEQRELAEKAKSGEKVSAKTPPPLPSPRDEIGPASASENALKDVELEDLRNAKRRLEIENIGLRAEIEDLKKSAAQRAGGTWPPPPPDEMLARVSAYIAGLDERGKHFMREAMLEHARGIIADGKGDIEAARKALASFQ